MIVRNASHAVRYAATMKEVIITETSPGVTRGFEFDPFPEGGESMGDSVDAFDVIQGDGNAFSIMSRVSKHMRDNGALPDEIAQYREEAMASGYDELLSVSYDYADRYCI